MAYAKSDLLPDYEKGKPLDLIADEKKAARLRISKIAFNLGESDLEVIHHEDLKRADCPSGSVAA